MATDPDIVSHLGKTSRAVFLASDDDEIEALRSRVADQDAELTRMARDAAWLARLARGSSWPGEMAQRVEDAADRVIAWAEQAAVTSTAGTDAP
jgi:hypothetical protein